MSAKGNSAVGEQGTPKRANATKRPTKVAPKAASKTAKQAEKAAAKTPKAAAKTPKPAPKSAKPESRLAMVRRARKINRELAEVFPYAHPELDFRNPFELLVATVLSAQTTDLRVNQTTPALFAAYPTPRTWLPPCPSRSRS